MSATPTSAAPVATVTVLAQLPPNFIRVAIPLLFGPLFNWALYGVLCVQLYVYSYNFPDDKRIVKYLTYFIFALETVQTALNGCDVYFWFAEGFGDVEHLKNSHYAPIDIPVIHAIISLIVQQYFCYRIWTLNKRSAVFCIFIALIAIVGSTGAAWGGIDSAVEKKYAVSKIALYCWAIPSVVADFLIATSMTLLLRRARSNGDKFAKFVMMRIVRLTIETNTLTATVAATSLVLYAAFPNEIYYTLPTGIIGKIYSNTLLVSLNNRIYFRDHPSGGVYVESGGHFIESDNSRSPMTSIHFAQIKQPTTQRTTICDTISHMADPEKGHVVDAASVSSEPAASPLQPPCL